MFNLKAVHAGFVEDILVMGQVSLVLQFSLANYHSSYASYSSTIMGQQSQLHYQGTWFHPTAMYK
jgi:hypothetical protein